MQKGFFLVDESFLSPHTTSQRHGKTTRLYKHDMTNGSYQEMSQIAILNGLRNHVLIGRLQLQDCNTQLSLGYFRLRKVIVSYNPF